MSIFLLGDNTFAKLGAITALSTLGAILVSRMYGAIIDERKGLNLLRIGAILNAMLHALRPFVQSAGAIVGINIANEPVTAAYRMPYMKGFYDAADSIKGYRIVYLASMGMVASVGRLALWIGIWIALQYYDSRSVLEATFYIAAMCSFGILLQRFEALRSR
jgi:hypothetical protein